MKNKIKFAALLAMLLLTMPTFAQNVSPKTKAQDMIENMCQTVQLNAATKQKAIDLMEKHETNIDNLREQLKTNQLSVDEFKAAVGESVQKVWRELRELIPQNQQDTYMEWRRKPDAERNAAPKK